MKRRIESDQLMEELSDEIWVHIFHSIEGFVDLRKYRTMSLVCQTWRRLVSELKRVEVVGDVNDDKMLSAFPRLEALRIPYAKMFALEKFKWLKYLCLTRNHDFREIKNSRLLSNLQLEILMLKDLQSHEMNEILRNAPTTLKKLVIIGSSRQKVQSYNHLSNLTTIFNMNTLSYGTTLALPKLREFIGSSYILKKDLPKFTGRVSLFCDNDSCNIIRYVGYMEGGLPLGHGTISYSTGESVTGKWDNNNFIAQMS